MQYYITLCYCCKNHKYCYYMSVKIELQSSTCNMITCIMCIVPMNIIRCVIIIMKHGKYMKHNTLRNIIFFFHQKFCTLYSAFSHFIRIYIVRYELQHIRLYTFTLQYITCNVYYTDVYLYHTIALLLF